MRGLLLLLLFCPTYLCLEFFSYGVPGSVSLGDPVWLYVDFDAEGKELDFIKWYKDDVLFYQFVPSLDKRKRQMNKVNGVYLSMNLSNATHVFLYTSDLATEGIYRCIMECGQNIGIKASKRMSVNVIPSEAPKINGVSKDSKLGDLVNITCVFGPSKPLAQIIWYINGEEANASYVIPMDLPLENVLPPLPTESLLSFVLDPRVHSVTCAAVMSSVYSSVSLELLFRAKGLKRILHAPPGQKGPLITGELERYNVGDEVDVNCSATETTHPSKLEWKINYEQVPPEFLSGDGGSSLGLRFHVTADHFLRRGMSLKCVATPTDFVIKTSALIPVYSSTAPVISPSLLWLVLLMYFS